MSEPSFFSAPMTVAKFWRLKPERTRLRAGMGPLLLDLTPKLFFSSTPPAVVASSLSRLESHVRDCSLDQKRRQDLRGTRERSRPCGEEPRHGCAKRRDRRAAWFIRVRQDLDLAHDCRLRGSHARGYRPRGPADQSDAAGASKSRDGV